MRITNFELTLTTPSFINANPRSAGVIAGNWERLGFEFETVSEGGIEPAGGRGHISLWAHQATSQQSILDPVQLIRQGEYFAWRLGAQHQLAAWVRRDLLDVNGPQVVPFGSGPYPRLAVPGVDRIVARVELTGEVRDAIPDVLCEEPGSELPEEFCYKDTYVFDYTADSNVLVAFFD